MVYTGTIVTEAEIAIMVGENVDATGNTEANRNLLVAQAEAYLSDVVKYDIVTNWGSLSAIYRVLFSEWAARFVGLTLISYNMNSFTTRAEAVMMLNVHAWRMNLIQELIDKADVQDFMGV